MCRDDVVLERHLKLGYLLEQGKQPGWVLKDEIDKPQYQYEKKDEGDQFQEIHNCDNKNTIHRAQLDGEA